MAESNAQVLSSQCTQDIVGSRYALEVAFQTMKERCQRLQQRLSKVEDENMKLRLQKRKEEKVVGAQGSDEVETLQDKISELERQKQQLTHHVFMVTSENKQLWNRLSQSAKLNQSLGSQLTKISDTLHRHSTASNMTNSQLRNSMVASSSRDIFNSNAVLTQLSKCKELAPSVSDSAGRSRSILVPF